DPHDPRRLYIVAKDELNAYFVLFRSEDGGTHWQRSDMGIPVAADVRDMAFDPETPGQLYLATSSGLYGSQDWGTTWARRGLADKYVSRVAVDPGDPMVVLAVVPRIFSGGDLTLRSSDGGETFVQVFDEGMAFDFDPTRSGRLYGNASSRLYFSDDSGAHWTSLPNAPL